MVVDADGECVTARTDRRLWRSGYRNLVVGGELDPFEEDAWGRVRVGSVTFRVAKGIDRCAMTMLDPATLTTGPEPIRTLSRHRKWDAQRGSAFSWSPTTRAPLPSGTTSYRCERRTYGRG